VNGLHLTTFAFPSFNNRFAFLNEVGISGCLR